MAMTLVEASKYSNDVLQRGVIEKFVRRDPILMRLKFKDIIGNGLTYDVESAEAAASFKAVGDTWTEGIHTVTQTTAALKILGGDVEVDNFLKATRSNIMDLQQEAIDGKVKATRKAYMDAFYYGYSPTWTNEFDGLHYLIRSNTAPYYNETSRATTTATEVAGQCNVLDEAIDFVKGSTPDLIVSSFNEYRQIAKYLRGLGGATYDMVMGERVLMYDGIPWGRSEYISDSEALDVSFTGADGTTYYKHDATDGTALGNGTGSTSLFVLSFDSKGVEGLQNSPIKIEKVGTGNMETKDATLTRIKWYCGLMFQNILMASKYSGLAPDTVWTA